MLKRQIKDIIIYKEMKKKEMSLFIQKENETRNFHSNKQSQLLCD